MSERTHNCTQCGSTTHDHVCPKIYGRELEAKLERTRRVLATELGQEQARVRRLEEALREYTEDGDQVCICDPHHGYTCRWCLARAALARAGEVAR